MARRGNNQDNLSELNCENQQTSQYKRPRYKCNCGFSTFHHSEIVRHINTVAGAKRECPYCKQMYVNSNYGYSKMKLHMEKEHKKVFELEQWKPIETNPDARKQNFRIDVSFLINQVFLLGKAVYIRLVRVDGIGPFIGKILFI